MELKENSFYRLNCRGYNTFFKFKGLIDNNGIKIDGYYLDHSFSYISGRVYLQFAYITEIEEIDFSVIVNYLPNENLDKINFLRKQRIKSLLM